MKIRIRRGKPVNAIVEIETDKVMCAYAAGRGGKLELADGGMIALNGPEWQQWTDAHAPVVVEQFPEVPFEQLEPFIPPQEMDKKIDVKKYVKGKRKSAK